MKERKSLLAAAGVYVLLGLVLIFFPDITTGIFCTVAGLLLLAYGVISIVSFFLQRGSSGSLAFQAELILGVVSAIVGGFFLTHFGFITSVIPVVLGIYILIDALVSLKRGLDMRSMGYAGWTATFILSAVSLALGAVILWNPFHTGLLLWRLIGGAFLYQGVSDLWSIHTLDKLIRQAERD